LFILYSIHCIRPTTFHHLFLHLFVSSFSLLTIVLFRFFSRSLVSLNSIGHQKQMSLRCSSRSSVLIIVLCTWKGKNKITSNRHVFLSTLTISILTISTLIKSVVTSDNRTKQGTKVPDFVIYFLY
jgi:hypothetical protein